MGFPLLNFLAAVCKLLWRFKLLLKLIPPSLPPSPPHGLGLGTDNKPFYSCVLSCQAFDLEWGWRWPCCDGDQYLVSMITNLFAFERQQDFYHKRSTLASLLFKGLTTKHTTAKWSNQVTIHWPVPVNPTVYTTTACFEGGEGRERKESLMANIRTLVAFS